MKRTEGTGIGRDGYDQLPRYPLIVCAVLMQNPLNLGGLCRTCEVFRLRAMLLADLAIAQTPAFRSAATSAHYWQPLLSCPIAHLATELEKWQQQGYSLVALDVSSSAITLSQFKFPQRSVLILGQELTGIPTDILSLCDYVISIPRFGLVESLNVQTAGSIAIYEYIKQHAIL